MEIYVLKTKKKDLKPAEVYSAEWNDEKERFNKKFIKPLKRLAKYKYPTENYVWGYAEFLCAVDEINKDLSESINKSIFSLGHFPSVDEIKTIIKAYEPRTPKFKKIYHKYYFIYDYFIEKELINDGDEYAYVSISDLDRAINTFTSIVNNGLNYYGFMASKDDTYELKLFLKDLKQLKRFYKEDEKIIFDFSF